MAWTSLKPRQTASAVVALAGVTLAVGCTADRTTYVSTAMSLKTVEVVDTLRDETLWTMDIPAEQKLIIDFDSPREDAIFKYDGSPPTIFSWELREAGSKTLFGQYYLSDAIDKGKVELPGDRQVIARMTIRPSESGFEEPLPQLFQEEPSDVEIAPTPAEPEIVEPAATMEPAPEPEPAADLESLILPEPEPAPAEAPAPAIILEGAPTRR
ncbi:hypothetical protein [Mucisphaera sp.]|uniref:hypothetical protein n=1 Tax=Mucisphaera sp. TaxID=2913024 RepID=UPI003D0D3898